MFLAEIGVSIVDGIGKLAPISDIRVILLISILFGLLIGCTIGLVLNIHTRRGGLAILGALMVLSYRYSDLLSPKEFYISILGGTIISLLSVFRVIEIDLAKFTNIVIFILYLVFLYSVISPLYPFVNIDNLLIQNNLIILLLGTAGFIAVRKVI